MSIGFGLTARITVIKKLSSKKHFVLFGCHCCFLNPILLKPYDIGTILKIFTKLVFVRPFFNVQNLSKLLAENRCIKIILKSGF